MLGFLVADNVVVGNPIAAVAKRKVPTRSPKALQRDRTPERLLELVAASERQGPHPWPERRHRENRASRGTARRLPGRHGRPHDRR